MFNGIYNCLVVRGVIVIIFMAYMAIFYCKCKSMFYVQRKKDYYYMQEIGYKPGVCVFGKGVREKHKQDPLPFNIAYYISRC